jgi:hypothetical protein
MAHTQHGRIKSAKIYVKFKSKVKILYYGKTALCL